ncbi:IS1/IS1595 family N-terminal zinc-binding domain-containing protein [Natronorarus salvus]|uniref:IS1/IS1595 family N-terminal zinc-binding domain-containing protein n=1 Tax=Natronorarus salvus TaxID=3117733 RepID=UPI002F260E06
MTADSNDVAACPHCDGTHWNARTKIPSSEPRYRCHDCGETFDEIRYRPPRDGNRSVSGLAKVLLDLGKEADR